MMPKRKSMAYLGQSVAVFLALCPCAVAQGQSAPESAIEIHVNRRCQQVYPFTAQLATKPDDAFCRLESVKTTQHLETNEINGKQKRALVTVAEQEYLLHNTMAQRVVFVVEHRVPSGWQVDSDPRPTAMSGNTAIFRAYAEPGETIRLHVGIRTTKLPSFGPEEPITPGAPDIKPPWEEIRY